MNAISLMSSDARRAYVVSAAHFVCAVFVLALSGLLWGPLALAADWSANFGAGSNASDFTVNPGVVAAASDGSGNYFVAGNFTTATLTVGATSVSRIGNFQNAFLLKYDATGTLIWAKGFGGAGAEVFARGVSVDSSGNVYLTGDFAGANLTTPALTKVGTRDALVFKLSSATGSVTWARGIGGASTLVSGDAVAVDPNGNVHVAGSFQSGNLPSLSLTRTGSIDGYLVRYDASGTVAWARRFGGAGSTTVEFRALATTVSGHVVIGGHFNAGNMVTPALSLIGGVDGLVIKVDGSGTVLWAKNVGGASASAYASGLAVDRWGRIHLAGSLQGASLTTPSLTLQGATDIFLVSLAADGSNQRALRFGGAAGTQASPSALSADVAGNLYLGGSFGGGNLTQPTLTKIGTGDGFALRLDADGGVTWQANFGGAGAGAGVYAIAPGASGDVLAAGAFASANLTTPALTKVASVDAFLVNNTPSVPTVTSPTSASVTKNSAVLGGNVTADGGSAIVARGVVHVASALVEPRPGGAGVTQVPSGAASTGVFTVSATGLAPGTRYSYAAYARNSAGGTSFSSGAGFTTACDVPGSAQSTTTTTASNATETLNVAVPFRTPTIVIRTLLSVGESIAVLTAPANGTASLSAVADQVEYVPGASFSGNDTMTVRTIRKVVSCEFIMAGDIVLAVNQNTDTKTTTVTVNLNVAAPGDDLLATVPGAPTAATATGGNASAAVAFSAPSSNGGATITSYTATCTSSDGGATGAGTGAASPVSVAGLTNGKTYTCTVKATNGVGTGADSSPSNAFVPSAAPSVPGAPTAVTATGGNASAAVAFSAPSSNGGATITSYTATCTSSDGGATGAGTGGASPVSVAGLTNGKTYTCTVKATNSAGDSAASAPSAAFSPTAPSPASAEPIPTLSGWLMMVMAGLLSLFGYVSRRRSL